MKTAFEDMKEIALTKKPWAVEIKSGLPLVFSPLLQQYPALVHAFTTRQGGRSKPPLDSFNIGTIRVPDEQLHEDVRLNRAKLCQSLQIPFEELVVSDRQIHSANVVLLEAKSEPGEVDGIATSVVDKPIIMQYADCVPVVIYDPVKNIVCVVHAGWRGTADAIVKEAVRLMINDCGSLPSDVIAAVGPAIGSCCFAVGLEVVMRLVREMSSASALSEIEEHLEKDKTVNSEEKKNLLHDRQLHAQAQKALEEIGLSGFFIYNGQQIYVDLKAINAYQLLSIGISQVDVTDFCTFCRHDLFYSYRRSCLSGDGKTGHHGAIASLR